MPRPRRFGSRFTALLSRIFCVGLLAIVSGTSLFANTASSLRSVPAGNCYCCCNQLPAAGGCVKMCELPKYASRWWATTCAKPRMRRPAHSSDAGPHIRRPDRATYAKLQPKAR